ncbi:MAG: hypothetical protein HY821_08330 [Acidobacteria bacterium]|nr:hypothetical protein [Acidobacteriota bacterium]
MSAFEGDSAALERLNLYYERSFTPADRKAEIWRRVYAFRQRSSRVPKNYLALEEAQLVLAQDAGYPNWEAFLSAVAAGGPPNPAFEFDPAELCIAPRRRLTEAEWDSLLAVAAEHRVTSLEEHGLMTDRVLHKVAALPHIKDLRLGGSRELTDDGLLALARMPQLERLDLSEYSGGRLTDRGLEALAHLPGLRQLEMCWQGGITDAGVAHLKHCPLLESVSLMGAPVGDGLVEVLAGKAHLKRFSSGRLTTDRGLARLRELPLLHSAEPGFHLLLDGPFSGSGLAQLAGLPGIVELDLFWHVTGLAPGAFAHLASLPNLQMLGCDGDLSGDEAMAHIAALPRLRRLRIQESAATDEGFVALSRSQSIEFIWARESVHFSDRGFLAFSQMSALRSLGISLQRVSDSALAVLPHFPELRELTPVGLQDAGFAHVGRCQRLERLTCMYCRDSTDLATEQITALPLKYYYAGLTKITDRSLELLGGIDSLGEIEFCECRFVTDAGIPFLTRLPNLKRVGFGGLPHVTLTGTQIFPPHVTVRHSN